MNAVLKPRPTKRSVYHHVEIDLDEFDDEDLVAELQRRRVEEATYIGSPTVEDLYLAMKFGNHKRALELLREYLMNATGRVLP